MPAATRQLLYNRLAAALERIPAIPEPPTEEPTEPATEPETEPATEPVTETETEPETEEETEVKTEEETVEETTEEETADPVDTTELEAVIVDANKLIDLIDEYAAEVKDSDYLPEMKQALQAGENIVDDEDANQKQVDDAADVLNTALEALLLDLLEYAADYLDTVIELSYIHGDLFHDDPVLALFWEELVLPALELAEKALERSSDEKDIEVLQQLLYYIRTLDDIWYLINELDLV
jgi:hypothetical protein